MSRSGPALVYVHGAGTQPPEADWVRIHNLILFSDRPAPPTDLGYYADLMHRSDHGTPGFPGPETPRPTVADPTSGARPVVADLAERDPAPWTLGDSIHGSVAEEGRIHEAHMLLLRLAAAMGPADHRSRFAMPGNVIPLAVRDFYRELSGYLHGTPGIADAMRDRVRDAIGRNDGPLVVLAHSLGSIIAFDVLSEPDLAGREVDFVTVGSPLALGPVQDHLRAWRGSRPIEVPGGVATWRNFHADGDPVATGSALEGLRNDFAPALRIHSTEVRNEAEWHHALNGYLETPEVRDAIQGRLWWWSG